MKSVFVIIFICLSCTEVKSKTEQTHLNSFLGTWKIKAKDRTSPNIYEDNSGKAIIRAFKNKAGIEINYTGSFKEKPFLVKEWLIIKDSLYKKVRYDGEHRNVMTLNGYYVSDTLRFIWTRAFTNRMMTVKHDYYDITTTSFKYASYLSPKSNGEWQMTHQWIATRSK